VPEQHKPLPNVANQKVMFAKLKVEQTLRDGEQRSGKTLKAVKLVVQVEKTNTADQPSE
jgi:hypothetical protein